MATYEEFWDYLKSGNKHQLYHCELASEDPIVRGVAVSRTAEGILSLCRAVLSDDKEDLKLLIRPEIYQELIEEATQLEPRVAILNGAGLPAKNERAMKVNLGQKPIAWRNPDDVKRAASYLVDWLQRPSKLRKAMKTLQLGGLFYSTHVDILCMNCFIKCADGKSTIVEDAVARLCQSKPMSAGTRIAYD